MIHTLGAPLKSQLAGTTENFLLSLFDRDDEKFWPKAVSLSRERNPSILARGLFSFAGELRDDPDRFDTAAAIYRFLLDGTTDPVLRSRAQSCLEDMQGRGSFRTRLEFGAKRFLRQWSDPVPLIFYGLGGAAFRMARFTSLAPLLGMAKKFAIPDWGVRALASGAGLLTEASVITSLQRWGHGLSGASQPGDSVSWASELASNALLLGSFRATGWAGSTAVAKLGNISFAPTQTLRGLQRLSQTLMPSASALAGVALGDYLETALGHRPEGSGDFSLFHGLLSLAHFHVSGYLTRRLAGEAYAQWERDLDFRTELLLSRRNAPPQGRPGARLAWASGYSGDKRGGFEEPAWRRLHSFSEGRSRAESGLVSLSRWAPPAEARLSAEETKTLMREFQPLFPEDGNGYYSEKILQRVCEIRCNDRNFHRNLLEALLASPDPGNKEQLFIITAMERVFATDAAATATGSFHYAPLQILLTRAFTGADPGFRQRVLATFKTGFTRQKIVELLAEQSGHHREFALSPSEPIYTSEFHNEFAKDAEFLWKSYHKADHLPLFNFVYRQVADSKGDYDSQKATAMFGIFVKGRDAYSGNDINQVLGYARYHPLGHLLVLRLMDIFAAGDFPGKLREIAADPEEIGTEEYLTNLGQWNSPDVIAERINGTGHIGHLNNLGLAQKVVSVFRDVAPLLQNPRLLRPARHRLIAEFEAFAKEYPRRNLGDARVIAELSKGAKDPKDEARILTKETHFRMDIARWAKNGELTDAGLGNGRYQFMHPEGAVYLDETGKVRRAKLMYIDAAGKVYDRPKAEIPVDHYKPALLQVEDLMRFLNANSNSQSKAMFDAWTEGNFHIEILPPEEFDAEVAKWGKAEECNLAIFIQSKTPQEKDRILIKDLPPLQLYTPKGYTEGYNEMQRRVRPLVHEIDHWDLFSNSLLLLAPSFQAESSRITLRGISREDRLVSEMRADLEEFRWRARNTDHDIRKLSRYLGVEPAEYLRSITELNYFAKKNRARGLR